MACFALRPAFPSALWVRFGGLPLGKLDFKPVDWALDSLRRPTTVEDRLGVLRQLVEFWHGPIGPKMASVMPNWQACPYRCRCGGGSLGRKAR